MSRRGINQKELASRLGVTQPVLSKKFKLNNWRESDLQEIAQVCGAEYITLFKYNDEIIDQLLEKNSLKANFYIDKLA